MALHFDIFDNMPVGDATRSTIILSAWWNIQTFQNRRTHD